MKDADVPPGWNSNPSAWSSRLPVAGLAVLGLIIATYLALFQYGVIRSVWEPLFGDGSRQVLTSNISDLIRRWTGLPIKDAALGAFAYFLDVATSLLGGRRRWRTVPWLVAAFGVVVGLLGGVGMVLVVIQGVIVEAWCTLCLASAVISTVLIGPALTETLAMLQHLRREGRRGRSWWSTFWGLEGKWK